MKRLAFALLVLLAGLVSLGAQDGRGPELTGEKLGKVLEYLRDEAVSVEIHARITDKKGDSVWNTESRQVTVSGRSVTVTLEGDNIRVVANIVPFINEDETILIIAKGEVWIESEGKEEKEYYSTMKSLPVEAGESVLFFPIGVAVDTQKNVYTIEMEIQVHPYVAN